MHIYKLNYSILSPSKNNDKKTKTEVLKQRETQKLKEPKWPGKTRFIPEDKICPQARSDQNKQVYQK